jgi:colanic acid biosynthesis protein WcaH
VLVSAIRQLESAIESSKDKLPDAVFLFLSRVTPLVNVDLLIHDNDRRTLLTWRDDEFYGPGWHVPGGIVRFQERTEDRIRLVALHELGASVEFDANPLKVLETIARERRDRGHFVSLIFRCRLTQGPDPRLEHLEGAPINGQWRWHTSSPKELIPEQRSYADFMVEST